MIEQARTVFGTFEFLFEQHIVYKIQVYLFGKVEHGTFDKISRVEHYIQMSVESERLGVKWGESQIYTRFTGYLQCIHQIILIESRTDAGQWTDKLIGKQGNVIFVNIHILENFVDSSLHPLFGKELINTRLFASFHPLFLGAGRFPIIIRSKQLSG